MIAAAILLAAASALAADEAPAVVPLWPAGAPGSEARRGEAEVAKDYWVRNVHDPSLTVFLPPPEKANGAAVVICPGGGHHVLVYDAEGVDPARFFNGLGVAAFVLKYRLAREEGSPYSLPTQPLQDGRRALRVVRSRAKEWGVDPSRVGVMGFSAGGEVASLVAFSPPKTDPGADDPVDRLSARPDFLVEIYPGPLGVPEAVPKDAPPAFLLVADDDRNSAKVVTGLLGKYREAGASVEAHVLARGGHGFNMGRRSKLESVKTWPLRLGDWMADGGLLAPAKPATAPTPR